MLEMCKGKTNSYLEISHNNFFPAVSNVTCIIDIIIYKVLNYQK